MNEIKFEVVKVGQGIIAVEYLAPSGWKHYMLNNPEMHYDGVFDDYTYGYTKACPRRQYTGLKDKNGKEIYEGDIVISFKKPYEDAPSKNIVQFTGGGFRLKCEGKNDIPLFNYEAEHLEVIGNIYENAELLNVQPNSELPCGNAVVLGSAFSRNDKVLGGLIKPNKNKMSKSNRTSSAANAFGAGSDLVGLHHKGHEIVSASRQYMHLNNGETVARAGNRVEHERTIVNSADVDNTAYMTDDL